MSDWPGQIPPARPRPPRGQPIAALAILLGSWVAVRAAPLSGGEPGAALDFGAVAEPAPLARPAAQPHRARLAPPWPARLPRHQPEERVLPPRPQPVPVREPLAPAAAAPEPRIAGGHQMLWLAGLAMVPLPPEARPALARAPALPSPPDSRARLTDRRGRGGATASLPRWSADGWILWRRGGNGYNLPGAGLPGADLPSGTYGASQAGLVVRYRLAPGAATQPALFVRATSALKSPRGEELAAGLSLRPVKGVPVIASAELRAARTVDGNIALRPAAGLVSEFSALHLPLEIEAETYVAAGFVAGRGATPFIDGQTRLERRAARLGPAELRIGGGAWGGAQRGAQRLDVGPAATFALPVGKGGVRLRADWRFRVAGAAAPASGPALTLSAGF